MTLDRRTLIQSIAGAAAFGTVAPRFSYAATSGDRRLIVIILRGALDGLAAVPAFGDPDYARARGAVALPREAILDLDGQFGLNAKLPTFKALWDQKQLAIVHAVCSPYRERSHFDGQNVIETGGSRPSPTGDGWLNRALGPFGVGDPKLALAIAQAVPVILQGKREVSSWMPPQLPAVDDDFIARLKAMYARDPELRSALDRAMEVGAVANATGGDMQSNAQAMRGGRGYRFEPLAKLAANIIAAPDGPRITIMEVGGWDTHQNQGTTQGQLAYVLDGLDKGVKVLGEVLKPIWDRTTILCFTEFGRTVAANGSNGTDHGMASVAFVAGGAVNGGRVQGAWPGLRQAALYEGRDLMPTTDLRAVFKGILADHMRMARGQVDSVFADSASVAPVAGLIRT
ncbi:MAG: DUF1501 domain-containing protein [Alphaproteobacteria bacterium]|nr:DUF1501 domain-containing protein [Alphaproteobacteria bacterium]